MAPLTPPKTTTTETATTSTDQSLKPQAEHDTVYTHWRLFIYDIWVLGIVSTWAWGCRISTYLIPLFRANVGTRHLDIGAGTGYYLRHAHIPSTTQLTILDNEEHALNVAIARAGDPPSKTHGIVADILQPLPTTNQKFESVSMYYLLHSLPVPVEAKCQVFVNIKKNMTKDGVVHGANVLG